MQYHIIFHDKQENRTCIVTKNLLEQACDFIEKKINTQPMGAPKVTLSDFVVLQGDALEVSLLYPWVEVRIRNAGQI